MKKIALVLLILTLPAVSIAALNTQLGAKPPKDAIILFDGTDMSQWTSGDNKPSKWQIEDGIMQIVLDGGSITTRRDFRDFQLHLEFNVPLTEAKGQGRGNSGIYIQRRYEVQILDSYGVESKYQDCGAIYKTKAPDKNVCKKPDQWQYYDIAFTAPKWQGDKKVKNARITVYQNGTMIHNDFEIPDKTGAGQSEGPSAGPILLQNHNNVVKFRNIWIIPQNETPKQNALTDDEIADGWKLLFDGRTSNGWRSARAKTFPQSGWSIKNGTITVNSGDGAESKRGGDIVTLDQYSDFELKVDFKITPGANSGIKYFVIPELLIQKGSAIGCEFQVLDDEKHPDAKLGIDGNRTIASLYDLLPAKGKYPNPPGQWNTARIVSNKGNVEHWLNGRLVLQYNRFSDDFQQAKAKSKFKNVKNFATIEKGFILIQDHGNEVSYKNIKIKTN